MSQVPLERVLALLRPLVEVESPTGAETELRELAALVATRAEALGGRVRRHEVPGAGAHVEVSFGPAAADGEILVLGHLDTVHPVGTLERMPFEIEGERLRGPGVYDMKAGVASFLVAMASLREDGGLPRPVRLLLTCDEETGSATSRGLIESRAARAAAALVLEPSLPGGAIKTARKGVARWVLRVEGVAAHAGIEPERGASAIHELARQVGRLQDLADADRGTTVNVGRIEGGTGVNVVAARATCEIDVRFWTSAEADRLEGGVRGLRPHDPRCRVEVEGGVNRPPLEPSPASEVLLDHARAAARRAGRDLDTGRTGGASDGNFTAGAGCPTLDGLGPDGGGAHTPDEHVLLEDLAWRPAFYVELLRTLGGR